MRLPPPPLYDAAPALLVRLAEDFSWLMEHRMWQIIVNGYRAGKGIGPQIELEGFGPIVHCLSLGSDTIMKFSREGWVRPLQLPRHSLLILTGEARYKWMHGIPNWAVTAERKSITFRG